MILVYGYFSTSYGVIFVIDLSQLTEKNQYLYSGLAQFSVFGISHHELLSKDREKYALSETQIKEFLTHCKAANAENCLVISTCNRTEVYAKTNRLTQLIRAYTSQLGVDNQEYLNISYVKEGLEAVRHLFQVSAGVHSQILGDFEIIGQVRKAFKISKAENSSGTFLERLINTATQMSKRIKNQTEFSSGVTSTAYAAVNSIRKNYAVYSNVKVTIFGLGKIGSNVCENLVKHFPPANIRLINRSVEKAEALSKKYGLDLFSGDFLPKSIIQSDAMIVATGASQHTVTLEMIPADKEMLIIDLSVPRNVHPEIDKMPLVTVLGVDEISKMNAETLNQRKAELDSVNKILDEEMDKFKDWMESRKHASAIQAIKQNFHDFQSKELKKAKKNPEDQQVQKELEISNKVINRITGHIFSNLKELNESELEAVYKLFQIDKSKLVE